MTRRCGECKNGEHDNYDDNVLLTKLIDPTTGEHIRSGRMCDSHREMYLQDGYQMKVFVDGIWQTEGIGLYHGRRD